MKPISTVRNWRTKSSARSTLTLRPFINAALFTNAVMAPVLIVEFVVLAIFHQNVSPLIVGAVLLFAISAAIWIIAGLIGGICLVARWGWITGMERRQGIELEGPGASGVWDDWLDP